MPSVSGPQHNLMELVAHDPAAAHRLGIAQSVGRDFVAADKGKHFAAGGTPGFGHLDIPHIEPGVREMRGHPHASGAFNRPALALGGDPMGISGSAADPWWTRAEARGADQVHPGGLVNSATAGRADHVPTAVAADSYILPADVVSGLGAGNSLNGAAVTDRMMHSAPYGISEPRPHGGNTIPHERLPSPGGYATGGLPGFAEGRVPHGTGTVPVRLSGGEVVLPPWFVHAVGRGDIERGHDVLDAFVKKIRARLIKKLRSLPGPKRD